MVGARLLLSEIIRTLCDRKKQVLTKHGKPSNKLTVSENSNLNHFFATQVAQKPVVYDDP